MQFNTQATSSKPFQSLRERCGFKFTLALTPPYFKSVQPSYNNVPRRRKRTCVPAPLPSSLQPSPPPPPKPGKLSSQLKQFLYRRRSENYQELVRRNARHARVQHPASPLAIGDLDDLLATPCTPHFAACDESRCLQEIIPGCYVAFEDDNAAWFGSASKDTLATPNGRGWTHIVSISEAQSEDLTTSSCAESSDGSDSNTAGTSSSSDTYNDEAVQTLRIYLPPDPEVEAEDEDSHRTILTDAQLIAARDFLSFHGHALQWNQYRSDGEYSSSPSSFASSSSSTLAADELPVRLLITAPRNRRADALSVALFYLAFAFDSSVETFLRELHSQRRCLSVWKHVLDRECAQRLNKLLEVSGV